MFALPRVRHAQDLAGRLWAGKEIKKEAEEFLNAAVKHPGDDKIETAVLDGETADAIIEQAEKWKADLIVMGSHTHKEIERLFVPDVAAHVFKAFKNIFTLSTYS